MEVLIIKTGATGDVVRTTPLLRRIDGRVTWLTESKNAVLLQGLGSLRRCLSWEERHLSRDVSYDLVINLEDSLEVGLYLNTLEFKQLFGAHVGSGSKLRYTEDSRRWFDLSLISSYGKEQADKLKFQNRHTYQELIFDGLGFRFAGETYLLPEPNETELSGEVEIAASEVYTWVME